MKQGYGYKIKLTEISLTADEKRFLQILAKSLRTEVEIEKELGVWRNSYWILRNMLHNVLVKNNSKHKFYITKRGIDALRTGKYDGFPALPVDSENNRPTLKELALRGELLRKELLDAIGEMLKAR